MYLDNCLLAALSKISIYLKVYITFCTIFISWYHGIFAINKYCPYILNLVSGSEYNTSIIFAIYYLYLENIINSYHYFVFIIIKPWKAIADEKLLLKSLQNPFANSR